jgi:polar amino acid transport system permease protein
MGIAVMRMSRVLPIRWFAAGYLEFFRNTPLLVQIFFWYFGAYQILPQQVNDWLGKTDFEFTAAVIALTIYTSAFIAEDIRSGIRSIPKEQMEAARSFGLSYIGAMRYVILPQAIRIIVPPLINQFLNLTKNSSLAMTIGVAELTYQARQVESYTLRPYEPFLAATFIYLALSLAITGLVTLCDRKLINTNSPTNL